MPTVEMTAAIARNERRLRLVFSANLAAGAFTTFSYYTIANQDGKGIDPNVVAALVITDSATNVELVLDNDLVAGALYQVSAIGVPSTNGGSSTSASTQLLRMSAPVASNRQPNTEPATSDAELLLYGIDLIWNGTDFQETANGDLDRIGGTQNALQALLRRATGHPLLWAPNYSPNARVYVDSPQGSMVSLRGKLQDQMLRDDRVKSVAVKLQFDDDEPDQSFFTVASVLIGGQAPAAFPVTVPS